MCKKRIGVVFGGRTPEHEVSLASAANVIEALDSEKFVPVYIGITKKGEWKLVGFHSGEVRNRKKKTAEIIRSGLWEQHSVPFAPERLKKATDFILPVIHGSTGEDGRIQGFLEILGMPYAGCGVFASAVAMDKRAFKEVMIQNGLPVCPYMAFDSDEARKDRKVLKDRIAGFVGFPCFIKPAGMGSSIGITKVSSEDRLDAALETAAALDTRIIAEKGLDCRELETAVIGNTAEDTGVSVIGEIVPEGGFYDYMAKYGSGGSDTAKSRLRIPADIEPEDRRIIKKLALRAYRAIDGKGFCRADFFKDKNTGKIYINEINTIPGFTGNSMFPLLWRASGFTCSQIIERIIDLGYERHYAENRRNSEF